MWLLNAKTRRLEYFIDDRQVKGQYAVLSHCWGDEEVSFQEIGRDEASAKAGYAKIERTCQQALEDRLSYCWVDTCCIDKTSSAELSEAINSMYRWYRNAFICYAYIYDVHKAFDSVAREEGNLFDLLRPAKWFTRGFTLQELIAPREVRFFDAEWFFIGSKTELLETLSAITRIHVTVLKDRRRLYQTSIAKRMSWASGRATSRPEDEAYCLLGIFDVNLPLLYGEGAKAFQRLQEEIIRIRSWPDHSILAHTRDGSELLASSPMDFQHADDIVSWPVAKRQVFELSSAELRISSRLIQTSARMNWRVLASHWGVSLRAPRQWAFSLNCSDSNSRNMQYALTLQLQDAPDEGSSPIDDEEILYRRAGAPITIHRAEISDAPRKVINVSRKGETGFVQRADKIRFSPGPPFPTPILPLVDWDQDANILTLAEEPLERYTVQLGLRWSGSVLLHLAKALTVPSYTVELHLRTSTERDYNHDMSTPKLTIWFKPISSEIARAIETAPDELPDELSYDLDTWIATKMSHDFLDTGTLTLQRDDCDVLRIDARHLTVDGETMWELTFTELIGMFMVE